MSKFYMARSGATALYEKISETPAVVWMQPLDLETGAPKGQRVVMSRADFDRTLYPFDLAEHLAKLRRNKPVPQPPRGYFKAYRNT